MGALLLPLLLLRPEGQLDASTELSQPRRLARPGVPKILLWRLLGLGLGLTVFLILPVRAGSHAPVNWENAGSLPALLRLVSGPCTGADSGSGASRSWATGCGPGLISWPASSRCPGCSSPSRVWFCSSVPAGCRSGGQRSANRAGVSFCLSQGVLSECGRRRNRQVSRTLLFRAVALPLPLRSQGQRMGSSFEPVFGGQESFRRRQPQVPILQRRATAAALGSRLRVSRAQAFPQPTAHA